MRITLAGCASADGTCTLELAANCTAPGAQFFGTGTDCTGCTCLYRATSPTLDASGLFRSPRAGNGIAFATPNDVPHACPFASGDRDPDLVLAPGAPVLVFYQVDAPGAALRVTADRSADTVRIDY